MSDSPSRWPHTAGGQFADLQRHHVPRPPRRGLGWFADALPGEPVVLCTQTANDRSMRVAAKLGFIEVERFEEFGAEQWFGARSS